MTSVTERIVGLATDDHLGEIEIKEVTISSAKVVAKVLNYGGILNVLEVKTSDEWLDVITGWETPEDIVANRRYSGRLVGRYANRIANGEFTIDDETYHLFKNNGGPESNLHSLHGGEFGFDRKLWSMTLVENGVALTYVSVDGEEGYPGELTARVTYTVVDNKLQIAYHATTTKKTVVNLTNHVYFNLDGHKQWSDLRNQTVAIMADHYTPADANAIPTGEIADVKGTTFDLRKPVRLTKDNLAAADSVVGGYDHNFCLKQHNSIALKSVALAKSDSSGITLELRATQPGLQFYTSQFLDGKGGKHGNDYGEQTAFCLETQHYPDSPNQAAFPSALLEPENEYNEVAQFIFTIE